MGLWTPFVILTKTKVAVDNHKRGVANAAGNVTHPLASLSL